MRERRERALHAFMALVALGSGVTAAVAQTTSSTALALLGSPVAGLPLGVVLLVAVPVTVWLCSRTLQLTSLGGAVQIAPDSAVLGLVLWAGAGAMARAGGDGSRWGQDAGSLFALCAWVWLVWLTGVAAHETASRQRRGWVRAFNVGLSAIAGAAFLCAAVGVRTVTASMLGAGTLPPEPGPWDTAAVLAGAAAYVAVDLLLSATSVALGEGGSVLAALADESTALGAAAVMTLSALAVLGGMLLVAAPWSLLLLAPVAVAVTHAAGRGARANAERAASVALYEAAEQCQRADSADEVLVALVAGAARVSSAPADLRVAAPAADQIGARLVGADGGRWLVCGPRGAGHAFEPSDERTLATLARMGTESLARVEAIVAIRDLATRDPLTGAANRATLTRALHEELATAGPTALLFGDVDGFKAVNDELGHLRGDELLIMVARRLAAGVRPRDLVARLGGDEFAVLLPATSAADAADLAARLSASVGAPVSVGGAMVDVSISLGSAATDVLPVPEGASPLDPAGWADRLIDAADQAMYRIKRSPRTNRHHQVCAEEPEERRGLSASGGAARAS